MEENGNVLDVFTFARSSLEKQQKEKATSEKTAIFVGEKKSGKSTLIGNFLNESKKDDLKSTAALEYKYCIKNTTKLETAHIYELGSGKLLANLINAPINAEKIFNSVVLITVDLSKPGLVLETIQSWLAIVRDRIDVAVRSIPPKSEVDIESWKSEALDIWRKHEDGKIVKPFYTKVVVVGTKYDIFANYEAEKRKWLSRAIRFFCHINGCDLIFVSTLEKNPLIQFKMYLNKILFGTDLTLKPEKEHNKPIYIPTGHDTISSIGEPRSGGKGSKTSIEQLWVDMVEEFFPRSQEKIESSNLNIGDMNKYAEAEIDAVRKQKEEELDRYKKEQDRQKRIDMAGESKTTKNVVIKRKVQRDKQ